MKRLLIISIALFSCLMVWPEKPVTLSDGESAIVYSLPKTKLCITVITEKVTQKPGMFYRYSERYLATSNVITEEKTFYRLKNIEVKAVATPDENRTYSVSPAKNILLSKLTVNDLGILCGINVASVNNTGLAAESSVPNTVKEPEALLPLGEEYMMAGSEAKLAEGAAKQIYRIRESRLSLLTADVDHMPADGSSFKTMMDGLNKMEKKLTELFIGKTTTETITQNVYYVPSKPVKDQVVFRLSAFKGIVPTDDLSGTPFYITVSPSQVGTVTTDSKAKKETSSIYTILPAQTQITIGDGINALYKNEFFIPQFGILVPIPLDVFKKNDTKVSVDSQTGRLLSIE